MLIEKNSYDLSKIKNRFKQIRSYTGKKCMNPAYPVELILEITNLCNLECVMCPRKNMTRSVGYMDIDIFKNIIDQVKGYIELVYLSGGLGEPLLHPQFEEMVQYCVKSDVKVGISTNATLLNSVNTEKILRSRPSLILLSLDGATKELHEKIRVGSKFEKTMANVEYFLNEKARRHASHPYTIVQMIYMPENSGEEKAFRAKWKVYKGVDDIRLKKFLHLQGADRFPLTNVKPENHQHLSCILPWRQLSISWDGTLALCCRDLDFKHPIGNIISSSILELWNSKEMVDRRRLLATGNKSDIPLCKDCLTIKTNALTRNASIFFDGYTTRKLLPALEKIVIKTGMKMVDYE